MKIGIIGYGKMGKMIELAALEQGHTITAIVDPLPQETTPVSEAKMYTNITAAENLSEAEVAIEFTRPDTALANIQILAEKKIPAVIGTTGWHDHLDEARQAVEKGEASLIWASNFSLGVNIFYHITWYAARLINSFPEYDLGGLESHHNKKLDSPSGTAKTLVEGILKRVDRKNIAVWEALERAPQPNELHFPSLRVGSIPGTHSLFLDSPADTIEITHTARNREGFAGGAIRAAQWLITEKPTEPGKAAPRKGLFTMDDMLKDILG